MSETLVVRNPNQVIEGLEWMREKVLDGRWIRDYRNKTVDGVMCHCMLGLIDAAPDGGSYDEDLLKVIRESIDESELEEIRSLRHGTKLNEGTVRGFSTRLGIIASYNNTRRSPRDIVAWIDRAKKLIRAS